MELELSGILVNWDEYHLTLLVPQEIGAGMSLVNHIHIFSIFNELMLIHHLTLLQLRILAAHRVLPYT